MRSRFLHVGLLALLATVLLAACDKDKAKEPGTPATSTKPQAKSLAVDGGPAKLEKVEIPEVRVKSDASTTIQVRWLTPPDTAVNDEAPFRVQWNRSDGLVEAPSDVRSTGAAVKDGFRVNVQPLGGAPNATLDGEIHIVVCEAEHHDVCLPVRRSVELGFIVVKDASPEATVSIPLPQAHVL